MISNYLDGAIHRYDRSPSNHFDFSPTEVGHQVLQALIQEGYLTVAAPTMDDAIRYPTCFIRKP